MRSSLANKNSQFKGSLFLIIRTIASRRFQRNLFFAL